MYVCLCACLCLYVHHIGNEANASTVYLCVIIHNYVPFVCLHIMYTYMLGKYIIMSVCTSTFISVCLSAHV